MSRYFEFWCRVCGKRYFRVDPEFGTCNNLKCLENYLELAAVIDSADGMDGFMGIEKVARNRFPLDSRPS